MESTFSRFLEPRGFGTGYVPVMNEAAIEDCEIGAMMNQLFLVPQLVLVRNCRYLPVTYIK